MIISLIAAVDKNRLIGCNNRLPWYLPADLKNFRRLTMGKPILMGRCTYESIGCVLPRRDNIVITRNLHYQASGCTVVHTLESGLEAAKEAEEMMIIGGASLYEQTLPMAQRIYLTQVYESFSGDAWFPDLDHCAWIEIWQEYHSPDANNLYPYSFSRLERSLNLNES